MINDKCGRCGKIEKPDAEEKDQIKFSLGIFFRKSFFSRTLVHFQGLICGECYRRRSKI